MTLNEVILILADIKKYADNRDWTETMRQLADFVENHLDDTYFSLIELENKQRRVSA
jgi:hypothetical protein